RPETRARAGAPPQHRAGREHPANSQSLGAVRLRRERLGVVRGLVRARPAQRTRRILERAPATASLRQPERVARRRALFEPGLAGRVGIGQRTTMFAFVTTERFNVLDAKDRDRLETLSKLDEFKAGEEILVSGRTGEWLYLIVSGGVDIRARGKSGELVLGQLAPGDIFGELEAFADLPEGGVRHVARADTIVRAVNKHPLKQELKTHRTLASGLLAVFCRSISEKVRSANEVAIKLGPPGPSKPPPPAS